MSTSGPPTGRSAGAPVGASARSARLAALARRLAGPARRAVRSTRRGADEVSAAARRRPRTRGTVELVGRRQITGVVYARPDAPPVPVSLHLGRLRVAQTWAADPVDPDHPERGRAFRFAVLDVWDYTARGTALSVRVGGHALPIALRRSRSIRAARRGRRTVADLEARLAEGYLFGQGGQLQLPKGADTAWKDRVFGVYDRVRVLVADRFGYDVFAVYGTLLGAVREGDFIGHDLDFDAAYVSRHSEAREVLAELYEISRVLHADGLHVRSHASGLKIADAPGQDSASIDLMHLYFPSNDTGLKFAFGVAGTTTVPIEDWAGTTEFELAGHRILVPANAEQLVEHMYGSSWRVPNPGFDWLRDRTSRHRPIIIPVRQRELVRWNNHYRFHPAGAASAFAESLAARPDLPRAVVDLGCGDGRDSLHFAQHGRRVLGLDLSPDGIAHATKRAAELGLADRAEFREFDWRRARAVRTALANFRHGDGDNSAVLLYARFVLHAVPDTDQHRLLTALHGATRPGDVVALEFRTLADTSRRTWKNHYRRLIDVDELTTALSADYGFTPFEVQQGTGLSPIEREDPHLARILARR